MVYCKGSLGCNHSKKSGSGEKYAKTFNMQPLITNKVHKEIKSMTQVGAIAQRQTNIIYKTYIKKAKRL